MCRTSCVVTGLVSLSYVKVNVSILLSQFILSNLFYLEDQDHSKMTCCLLPFSQLKFSVLKDFHCFISEILRVSHSISTLTDIFSNDISFLFEKPFLFSLNIFLEHRSHTKETTPSPKHKASDFQMEVLICL